MMKIEQKKGRIGAEKSSRKKSKTDVRPFHLDRDCHGVVLQDEDEP